MRSPAVERTAGRPRHRPPVANPRHGHYLGYVVDGCRCTSCRGAWAASCRERYRIAKNPPPRPFGFEPLVVHVPDGWAPCTVLHISGTTLRSWIDRGMTVWEADRAAIRLGLHPSAVWHDWWEHTTGDLELPPGAVA